MKNLTRKRPVVLTIIDGLGLNSRREGNAFALAKAPVLHDLLTNYPHATLKAAGEAVGLPSGQMGNSEVGHLNIGAGEVVYTGLSLVNKSLVDKTFYKNKAFLKSIAHVEKYHSRLHIMGLLSPGGVHSLEEHLFAILDMCHINKVKDVSVHVFTDGRDVAPDSVKPSLVKLLAKLKEYNYQLASIQGRLYAMDRDKNFDKTELAYEALRGHADATFTNAADYVDAEYKAKRFDEFIRPAVAKVPASAFLSDNDAVLFFNFRPDRARQLAHLIVGSTLYPNKPKHPLKNVQMTSMMKYEGLDSIDVAFDAMEVANTLGKALAENHLKQLRIAETQKYAHVTFFMDGGIDIEYPGSKRVLIPSLKIDNFAAAPQMSAAGITDALLPILKDFDVVIMNYANPDMVGHTGDLGAATRAIEIVDRELGRLKKAVDELGGTMFITADHGNAEIMIESDGSPATRHTTSDVFFISTDKALKLTNGQLSSVTPTILKYLNLPIPSSMVTKPLF